MADARPPGRPVGEDLKPHLEEIARAAGALAAAVGSGAGPEMARRLAAAVEELDAAAEAAGAGAGGDLAAIVACASAVSAGLDRADELLSADYSPATRNLSSTFGDQLKHRLRRIGAAAGGLRAAALGAGRRLAEEKIVPPAEAVAAAELAVSGGAAVNALLAPSIAAAAAESEDPRAVPEAARVLLAGSAPARVDAGPPAREPTLEQIGLTFGGVYVPSGPPPGPSPQNEDGPSPQSGTFVLDLSGPGRRPAVRYRLGPLLDQRGSALKSSTPSFTEVKRHDTFVLAGEEEAEAEAEAEASASGASAGGASAGGPGFYRTLDGGGTWERLESEDWGRFAAGPSPVVGVRAARAAAAWAGEAGAAYSAWAEKVDGAAGGSAGGTAASGSAANTPTPGEVAAEAGGLRGAREGNPAYPPGVYSATVLTRALVAEFMADLSKESDFLAAVRGPPDPMESYIGRAVWAAAEKAAAGGSGSSSGAAAAATPAAARERGLTAIVQRRNAARAIRRRLIRASKNPEWAASWRHAAAKSAQASKGAYRALLEVAFVADTAVEKKGGSLPELSAKLAARAARV